VHHFITGVAGFIGSHLADSLLAGDHRVSGMDDFSLGRTGYLDAARASGRFHLVTGDCSQAGNVRDALSVVSAWGGVPDMIWHMAANSDIAAGVADATIDFSRTLQTTFATIEAARSGGVRRIAFASSSAVYGERDDLLTEESGPLLPISNYGATKLAGEGLLSAAAESFLDATWIFRFPNVVGPRPTHGVIYDFARRLARDPSRLEVLGNGAQEKAYLHVSELVFALRFACDHSQAKRNVFNIGPEGPGTRVSVIAEKTVAAMAPGAKIVYGGGDRGWVGDVPRFRYSTEKLAGLGWRPQMSSDAAVLRAITEIAAALH
jgi:UDP-glucose 4-epimerase